MPNIIPTPEFKLQNRMISPLEIDMWNIEGTYEDGKWHELIHVAIKNWMEKISSKIKAPYGVPS